MIQIGDDLIDFAGNLSVNLCKKYKLPITEDSKQEAMLGLCLAAKRFDPNRVEAPYRQKAFRSLVFLSVKDRILRYYWGIGTQKPRALRLKRYLHNRQFEIDTISNDIRFSTDGIERKVLNKDLVYKLMPSLKPQQARAITGFFLQDKDSKEIAEEEGLTRRALDYRIHTGLHSMMETYKILHNGSTTLA
jgi:RNA polymerase sigma factor (sigma-70 family)